MRSFALLLSLSAFLSVAADEVDCPVRVVELVDFGNRPGGVTKFGRASCRREFLQECGVDFVRFSYDASKCAIRQDFTPQIPEGTGQLEFKWRTRDAKSGELSIILVDAKGQMHRVKGGFSADEEWSCSRVDIRHPIASWRRYGAAADGKMHFPLSGVSIETHGKGAYDLAGIRAVTTADRSVLPDFFLVAKPDRKGAFWYPSETVAYDLALRPRTKDGTIPDRIAWRLTDYWNDVCVTSGVWRIGDARLVFMPTAFGRRFGSFCLALTAGEGDGSVARDVWFARLTGADPEPCGWVGTIAGGPAAASLYAAMGIGVMNTGKGWDRCERKKGEYDFGGIGVTITNLLARGIRPHLMIHCENHLYENPLDSDAFAAFAGAYARHCANFGARDIEIFNEPCAKFKKQYGMGDWTAKFVEFTHKARAAIKSAAPEMTVITCAEDMEFRLIPMLTNSIAAAGDAISIHPYCHRQPRPERGWFYKDNGAHVKRIAKKHCGTDNVRISEFGWTTYSGKGEYLEVAGSYPRASYAHQAQYVVRAYLIARMSGVEYSLQYRFDDLNRRNYTEHNFGFVFEDWTPKPSFAAVAFMTRLLGKAEPVAELSPQPGVYRTSSFVRDGRRVLACWAVEKDVSFDLPDDFGAAVRVYDLMGNELPVSKQGRYVLTERPIYIIGERR